MSKLIKCADHKYVPWGIVCVHLCEKTATEWLPVPQEPDSECENDWLCPECVTRYPDLPLDDLRAVCIHCIRELREETDGSSPATEGRT
jgi:hypothetical protein